VCDGKGIHPAVIDVRKYEAACEQLNDESRSANRVNLSWSVLDDDCKTIGRTNGVRSVMISDFWIGG
jgi:hypothetical protein